MAKAKPRPVRIEQRGAMAAMQKLETRTDEELEGETKFKAAAMAILGARAAERYDAKKSRAYFQRALAAARPQERLGIKRMADASLALAERRPDDLKASLERLGHEAPSSRALFGLRVMGLLMPAEGASLLLRLRGFALIILLVVGLLAIGLGIVELVSLPFGGIGFGEGLLAGLLVVLAALGGLAFFGRRKQAKAKAAAGRA